MLKEQVTANHLSLTADEILKDYRLAYQSRQAALAEASRWTKSLDSQGG